MQLVQNPMVALYAYQPFEPVRKSEKSRRAVIKQILNNVRRFAEAANEV